MKRMQAKEKDIVIGEIARRWYVEPVVLMVRAE
jgi:hypothetical protein